MKIALVTFALLAVSTTAFARPAYKKGLGINDCTACHVKGDMKKPNMENALYKTAQLHADNIKNGVAEFKDKACIDCHKGAQKPAK